MGEEIIGHGTWYDMMAQKVIARERKLGRNIDIVKTEMGLGRIGFSSHRKLG